MKTLPIALILSVPMLAASAELPDAPPSAALVRPLPTPEPVKKPRFDRTDWALLFANAGSRALDTYSTRWMLRQGDHELVLPGFVVNHAPVLAGFEGGVVAVDYFAARYLVRHHHSKLAKVALMTDFGLDAPGAIHNLFLKSSIAKAGTR